MSKPVADSHEFTVVDSTLMMKVLYGFAIVALLSATISVAGKWYGRSIAMGGYSDATTVHEIVIGNNVLAMPDNVIRFDKARRSETTSVTEVSARYERRHGVAMRVEFDARQQGGGGIDMRLVPEGNGRSLSIVADNAEPIVHYLGFEDIRGGHLRVTGRINSNTDPRAPADVDAQLENFRIQGNIGLAQILTLASFTGISDTLRGEGVFFAKAELPMEITRGRVTLKQARAFGPALGIRADGVIDTAARQVDLRGTVAPATMLNRFLGAIPLIGPLLVGTDSGGLVAISFSAKGPMDKPAISVNPLTILTPGFLRQIFEPSTVPAETVPENMPKPVGGDK